MMKSIDINIKKLEDKKEVLLDKLLEGAITNDMFNSKNADLENKISQLIIAIKSSTPINPSELLSELKGKLSI